MRGFQVALHHRALLALVALALICERTLTWWVAMDPTMLGDWQTRLQPLIEDAAASGRLSSSVLLNAVSWSLLPAAALIMMGILLLIGVVTLIRDLFTQGRYRSRQVLHRGGCFFWPVLRYKLPIYLAGSLVSVLVAALLWDAWQDPTAVSTGVAYASSLVWLIGFAVARVFLSLGTKIIVTEAPLPVSGVLRRVWHLARTDFGTLIIFYLLLIGLTGLTLLAIGGLAMLPIPAALRFGAALAVSAAMTLVMKAAAFDLYLQLAALDAATASHRP